MKGGNVPIKGRVVISDLYCKGCALCIAACPQKVLETDLNNITAAGYHPAHMVNDNCTGCAICAIVCPDAAITVFRETKKVVPKEE